MWKTYCVLVWVIVLNLTACGPSHPTRSEGHPATVPASGEPDAALAIQQLGDAKKLVGWRIVLDRQDVRAAIQHVGRVEQYKLEER